jgi:diguanylate cyclase (GGDEF)-like protein
MTGGEHDDIVNAVILAYRVSNVLGAEDPKPVLDMFSVLSQGLFRVTAEEERSILHAASADAVELSNLLEVQVGDLPDVSALLAGADEALVAHQTRQQHEQELLRQSSAAMTRQALTDGLTGVGNRKCFEQALADAFRQARDRGDCLGLILVGADRLGPLTDSLGLRAGDLVLQTLAARLLEGLGNEALVCRTGAAQFAVILPGASRADAARAAERLRRSIEGQHVDLLAAATNVQAVQVTASLGAAALGSEPYERPREPDTLLQLAERALAAAKQAGRNCVRVFNPGPPRSSAA